MDVRLVPVAKGKVPSPPEATRSVIKKFLALGGLGAPRWVQGHIREVAGGHLATVEVGKDYKNRLAFLPSGAKAAQFVDGPPPSNMSVCDLGPDRAVVLVDGRPAMGKSRLQEVEIPGGRTTTLYLGPTLDSVSYGPPGHVVARQGNSILLIKTDGAKGTVTARKEFKALASEEVVSSPDKLIHLIRVESPHCVEILGVYGKELRTIGSLPIRFAKLLTFLDDKAFIDELGHVSELANLKELYRAGQAGEVKPAAVAPGVLGFVFIDLHDQPDATAAVKNLKQLRFRRSRFFPCDDGRWVVLLQYNPNRRALAIVDKALRVRTIELPAGEVRDVCIDEKGTRALVGSRRGLLEVDLAEGGIQEHGQIDGLADFGPDGMILIGGKDSGGLKLMRSAGHRELIEISRTPLDPHWSFATALDGRVVVGDSIRRGDESVLVVMGIYGEEFRLLRELEPPHGIMYHLWRRGHVLMIDSDDDFQMVGLKEAWERGAGKGGQPKGRNPARTPMLDRLLAEIGKSPKRGGSPEIHERLLSGALPDDVRRLLEASQRNLHPQLRQGGLVFDEDLLTVVVGKRKDLVVIGSDGGSNLVAIEKSKTGTSATLILVKRADPMKSQPLGKTLEQLLGSQLPKAAKLPTSGPPGVKPPAQSSPTALTHLTCTEGGANKFWEAKVDGSKMIVRWGKIGSAGQTKTKAFPNGAAAQKELEKLASDKRAKGYKAGAKV